MLLLLLKIVNLVIFLFLPSRLIGHSNVMMMMLNQLLANSYTCLAFFCFQANVYHATKSDGQELAIKVYKTSVLVFK